MSVLKPVRGLRLNKSHPLARGLVGYWLLNEGSGNIVFDLSGNRNDGTLQADTHFVPGKFGPALKFDGTDDYVNCGAGSSLNLTKTIYVGAWVYPTSSSVNESIVSKWGNPFQFSLRIVNNKLYFYIRDEGVSRGPAQGSTNILLNKWSYVVGTYDGSNLRVYLNGIEDGIAAYTGGLTDVPNVDVLIGAETPSIGLFNGLIDIPMLYNRALSAVDIARRVQNPFRMFEVAASPKVVITVPAPAARHAVGFRPIEGAERLRGLRRSAFY